MGRRKGSSKFYGVTSLCLMYVALAIGVVAEARYSWLFAGIGIGISVLWVLPVAWFFCAKCCCRLDCGHVLLGAITRLLPRREPGPYTKVEGLLTLLSILIAVGYPQYWLAKEITLLAVFWGLMVVAGLEAMLLVCRDCSNTACPFNKKESSYRE